MSMVNTVLGPIPADQLGVTSVHECVLSVLPGAQYAHDIIIDRAEIFESVASALSDFRHHGGGTIVDSSGMFQGRDVRLLEALSRATGVHLVASTGMGPEALLGGYFLTPQTNPPTPWPAAKFADLFSREVTEGMVVPRVERRGPAGIVATSATRSGMTATDESLFRGAARTALVTGVPLSIRYGADARADLDVVLEEGLEAGRIVVGGLDRIDAVAAGSALATAERGAYVAIDRIGIEDDDHISDKTRVTLVVDLIAAGHADRVLLSSDAAGASFGAAGIDTPYSHILTTFVPALEAEGVNDEDIQRLLVANPARLLARIGS